MMYTRCWMNAAAMRAALRGSVVTRNVNETANSVTTRRVLVVSSPHPDPAVLPRDLLVLGPRYSSCSTYSGGTCKRHTGQKFINWLGEPVFLLVIRALRLQLYGYSEKMYFCCNSGTSILYNLCCISTGTWARPRELVSEPVCGE